MSDQWKHCGLEPAQIRAAKQRPRRSAEQVNTLVGPRWDLRGFAVSVPLISVMCWLVSTGHELGFDTAFLAFFVLMMSMMWWLNSRKAIRLARQGHACPGMVIGVVGGHLSTFQVQTVRGRFWLAPGMAETPEEGDQVVFFYGDRGNVGVCLSDGFAVGVRPSAVTIFLMVIVGSAIFVAIGSLLWFFAPA